MSGASVPPLASQVYKSSFDIRRHILKAQASRQSIGFTGAAQHHGAVRTLNSQSQTGFGQEQPERVGIICVERPADRPGCQVRIFDHDARVAVKIEFRHNVGNLPRVKHQTPPSRPAARTTPAPLRPWNTRQGQRSGRTRCRPWPQSRPRRQPTPLRVGPSNMRSAISACVKPSRQRNNSAAWHFGANSSIARSTSSLRFASTANS